MGRALRKCGFSSVTALFDKSKKSCLGKVACNICDHYFFGTPAYVILLGLIGTVITGFDIIRIMNSKSPMRCGSRQRGSDVVPIDVERDLKLMTSILGIEHYTLIMLGAITDYPMLHTPWLLMQLCVILVEIIVFFVRLFLDGLHVKRDEILLAFLAVHNWFQMQKQCNHVFKLQYTIMIISAVICIFIIVRTRILGEDDNGTKIVTIGIPSENVSKDV